MDLIKGLAMSLGMFSIMPVPKNSWNEKYMPMVIPNLPLVGTLIGFMWYALALILSKLSAPFLMQGAADLLIPFVLSGFIHADGYMDTADAVFSRGKLDDKKRILKAPNVGAFAVIAIIVLILLEFCAVITILDAQKTLLTFAFIPAISRCAAGIAMLNLKPLFESGYNVSFKNGTKPKHTIFICLLLVTILLAAWLTPGISAPVLLLEALTAILAAVCLYKQFGGMSGDLCGCVITLGECAALLYMSLI